MKKILFATVCCIGIFLTGSLAAQDFYGAQLTGKHTWGLSFKYDGDPWVGTHYNVRNFKGANPLDINLQAEIKIDKGISNIGSELAITPTFVLGTTFPPKGESKSETRIL
jgi:hypothetical protein